MLSRPVPPAVSHLLKKTTPRLPVRELWSRTEIARKQRERGRERGREWERRGELVDAPSGRHVA